MNENKKKKKNERNAERFPNLFHCTSTYPSSFFSEFITWLIEMEGMRSFFYDSTTYDRLTFPHQGFHVQFIMEYSEIPIEIHSSFADSFSCAEK